MTDIAIKSAEKFGTPQYLFLEDVLARKAEQLKNLLEHEYRRCEIYYPYKTNSLSRICKLLHQRGIFAEVASGVELSMAQKNMAEKIIFNGHGKSDSEIRQALDDSSVIINIDSIDELATIMSVAKLGRKKAEVGLRLRLSCSEKRYRIFGIGEHDLQHALSIIRRQNRISLLGLSFHIGTEFASAKPYINAFRELRRFIFLLSYTDRTELRFVDIGGGLGSGGYRKISLYEKAKMRLNLPISRKPLPTPDINMFCRQIVDSFRQEILTIPGINEPSLFIEPGRYLVNDSIHMLAKVLYIKDGFAIMDFGQNCMPNILNEVHPVVNLSNPSKKMLNFKCYASTPVDAGPAFRHLFGSSIKKGDILAIMNVGAYKDAYFQQFTKPRPKVVGVAGKKLKLLRDEEKAEDRQRQVGL
ncbi:MAG: hypothetical protein QXK37_02000 [Candidatus Woesearchaeota archaeon]